MDERSLKQLYEDKIELDRLIREAEGRALNPEDEPNPKDFFGKEIKEDDFVIYPSDDQVKLSFAKVIRIVDGSIILSTADNMLVIDRLKARDLLIRVDDKKFEVELKPCQLVLLAGLNLKCRVG